MNMTVDQAFLLFVEEPDFLPDLIGNGLVSFSLHVSGSQQIGKLLFFFLVLHL